jgi:hypothetical protein
MPWVVRVTTQRGEPLRVIAGEALDRSTRLAERRRRRRAHLRRARCAYLLAGLVFGVCYWSLGRLDPLAFNETDLSRARATYFSFVTLATLGYGDVVPRSELVQSLAIVEAVAAKCTSPS